MSKAFQCDVCFEFDEGEPVQRVTVATTASPITTQAYELCVGCLANLRDLLSPRIEAGNE